MNTNEAQKEAQRRFHELWAKVPPEILPDFEKSEQWLKDNLPDEFNHLNRFLEKVAAEVHKQAHTN